ncbi:hypothetical protein AC579_2260 [Pseudocercospora musae]|uniref:Calmodulin n=1 Tax=Pseudocercospora musae TaxID=113226 RepID=A0A139IV35_9PEZI|nr:hypothetical protein AC579_2260 [Pseudocercospora musae]
MSTANDGRCQVDEDVGRKSASCYSTLYPTPLCLFLEGPAKRKGKHAIGCSDRSRPSSLLFSPSTRATRRHIDISAKQNFRNTHIMESLSAQEKEHFKDAFGLFDKNGDGEISAAELGEVMRSLGLKPTDQELQDMLQEVDADNSGSIDLNGKSARFTDCSQHVNLSDKYALLTGTPEFMTMMSHRATAVDTEEELRQAFNVFDRDGSGTISVTELRDMLKALGDNLTDAEVDQIMKSADTDGDKTISFEEFKKIMEDST